MAPRRAERLGRGPAERAPGPRVAGDAHLRHLEHRRRRHDGAARELRGAHPALPARLRHLRRAHGPPARLLPARAGALLQHPQRRRGHLRLLADLLLLPRGARARRLRHAGRRDDDGDADLHGRRRGTRARGSLPGTLSLLRARAPRPHAALRDRVRGRGAGGAGHAHGAVLHPRLPHLRHAHHVQPRHRRGHQLLPDEHERDVGDVAPPAARPRGTHVREPREEADVRERPEPLEARGLGRAGVGGRVRLREGQHRVQPHQHPPPAEPHLRALGHAHAREAHRLRQRQPRRGHGRAAQELRQVRAAGAGPRGDGAGKEEKLAGVADLSLAW
mmetsp:Transcript_45912/g.143664  ORF Transcript_45912/g.143664 Transcript_45912/m.143664 type:complete len:332 (-) Transcript_45912:785-1780(-)